MKPVLLTRPLADSRRFAEALEAEGMDSLIWPLMRIEPIAPVSKLPIGIGGLLITSSHAIRAFAALDKRRDLPVLCVGSRTASVARDLGFGIVLSANGNVEAMARLAPGTGIRHFFYPRGRETARDLGEMLRAGGQQVTDMVLYQAVPAGDPPAPVAAALQTGALSAITLWSTRNAEVLVDWCAAKGSVRMLAVPIVAISDAVADPCREAGFQKVSAAHSPDAAGILTRLRALSAD
ncbi:MAG: uroporphyrinogen-III synthase [Pseudomonadota bacterium]